MEIRRILRSTGARAKLTIGRPNDKYEQEADRVADQVMRMSDVDEAQRAERGTVQPMRIQRACPECEAELAQRQPEGEEEEIQAKEVSGRTPQIAPDIESRINSLKGGGQPLDSATRNFFEPRFGRDFSDVRIHTDGEAANFSRSINARAFTLGNTMMFGSGNYQPQSREGKRLLGHELTHVLQQEQTNLPPQRQTIPLELRTSVDLTSMSETELQERYNLIVQTLLQFDYSSNETAELEAEAGQIGVELDRRTALAAGRTFDASRVEAMRQYFIANARSSNPASCIDTLNSGVRTLLNNPQQRMGGEVQSSMARLRRSSHAGPEQIIEFNDSRGRLTTGTREPQALRQSVWNTLIQMAGGDPGWSVFGMSLVDGYHSVVLTLDNNDPDRPRIYWSDQWGSRGGWQEFNHADLDAEVLQLTRDFRLRFNREHGGSVWPRTRVTLWRLRP